MIWASRRAERSDETSVLPLSAADGVDCEVNVPGANISVRLLLIVLISELSISRGFDILSGSGDGIGVTSVLVGVDSRWLDFAFSWPIDAFSFSLFFFFGDPFTFQSSSLGRIGR